MRNSLGTTRVYKVYWILKIIELITVLYESIFPPVRKHGERWSWCTNKCFCMSWIKRILKHFSVQKELIHFSFLSYKSIAFIDFKSLAVFFRELIKWERSRWVYFKVTVNLGSYQYFSKKCFSSEVCALPLFSMSFFSCMHTYISPTNAKKTNICAHDI